MDYILQVINGEIPLEGGENNTQGQNVNPNVVDLYRSLNNNIKFEMETLRHLENRRMLLQEQINFYQGMIVRIINNLFKSNYQGTID